MQETFNPSPQEVLESSIDSVFKTAAMKLQLLAKGKDPQMDNEKVFPVQRSLFSDIYTAFRMRASDAGRQCSNSEWKSRLRNDPVVQIKRIQQVRLIDSEINNHNDDLRKAIPDPPLMYHYQQYANAVQQVLRKLGYLTSDETWEAKRQRLLDMTPDTSYSHIHRDPAKGESLDISEDHKEEFILASPDLKGLKARLILFNGKLENCLFEIFGDGNKKQPDDIIEAIKSAIPALNDVFLMTE